MEMMGLYTQATDSHLYPALQHKPMNREQEKLRSLVHYEKWFWELRV